MTDKMINLTPDAINIYDADGKTLLATIKPIGLVARVAMIRKQVDTVHGIPIYRSELGEVLGEVMGIPYGYTSFIVPKEVRLALPESLNIYSPGELIRDESGQPIGCIGLESN